MTRSVFEPCAHTKLDFCGMIRFFVVSFTVVILNAVLSGKGQCVWGREKKRNSGMVE